MQGQRRRAAAARRHRHGPDASPRRLHRRARPLRRLQLVDRPARPRPRQRGSSPRARTVKILCVGKKGYDALRRLFAHADPRGGRAPRASSGSASPTPTRSARRCAALFEEGEFDVATLFYSRVPLGDLPDPDRAAAHPGRRSATAAAAGGRRPARLRIRAGRGDDPHRPPAAQPLGPDLPRAPRERRVRAGRQDDARWTTRRATPAR